MNEEKCLVQANGNEKDDFEKNCPSRINCCLQYHAKSHYLNLIIYSAILNNVWSSDYFPITRGVGQGCPLSPYILINCAEIIGSAIRRHRSIQEMHSYTWGRT